MIYFGQDKISELYYSETKIKEMYLGNNIVFQNKHPLFLTLDTDGHGMLTANTVSGYAGDTVELTTAYNTYYRFSGYDVTGGTINVNTFTFSDEDATVYAAFKPNAFTATGGWEKGSNVHSESTGLKNPINFNIGPLYAVHVSHTGDVPASWYSTSNRWQPSNASAYNISLKPTMKFTGYSRGNRPIEISAGTYVGNTFTQTAKRSENNAGSWTWTYNKSFTSNVQNNYRISAHVSGWGMINDAVKVDYISTATTGTWSATGYAP